MECLDACHGACVLKRPELSAIVAESLLYHDGKKYVVSDYIVMPNHVHVLAQFQQEGQMNSNARHGSITRQGGLTSRLGRKDAFGK